MNDGKRFYENYELAPLEQNQILEKEKKLSSILKTSTRKERDKSCSGDAEKIPRKN